MRAVVLSPHPDDAVLSLGASMHRAARSGWDVTVLTVLAGDPTADGPARSWDARAGFGTAAEAATVRQAEDRRACATLGVHPAWLPFGDDSYGRPTADEQAWAAVAGHLSGAERVLMPGFPLEHPDHVWLARLVLANLPPGPLVGLYAEEPYVLRRLGRPQIGDAVRDLVTGAAPWAVARSSASDRWAKLRACRAYRSQRRPLARSDRLMLTRIALGDTLRRGEWVSWLADAPHAEPAACAGGWPVF